FMRLARIGTTPLGGADAVRRPRDKGLPRPVDRHSFENQDCCADRAWRARCTTREEMPITPYLRSQVFEPETTLAMGVAFEKACRRLGLSLTPDAMTESVAKVIIDLAEGGETDAERLYQRALAHFGDAS